MKLQLMLAVALTVASACKREPAAPPPAPPAPQAPAHAASADPATAALPAPATAAALAEAATAAAARPTYTVALSISGGAGGVTMPQAGKPASFVVAPIDGKGQLVAQREPLLGAELLLVALRYDLSWHQIQRADAFNQAGGLRHEFKVTFPQAGRHLLYFLFRPKGGELASIPVDIQVGGKAASGDPWVEDSLRYAGPGQLEVGLHLDPAEPQVCAPLHVATTWLRKGQPLQVQGGDTGRVIYLLLAESTGSPVVGEPLAIEIPGKQAAADATPTTAGTAQASYKPLGGDVGTDALLVPGQTGKHKVLAIGDLGGKPEVRTQSAIFGLSVGGKAPAGGCPERR